LALPSLLARARTLPATLAYIRKHPIGRRDPLAVAARMAGWHLNGPRGDELRPYPWVGGSTLLAGAGMTGITGNLYYGLHEFVEMALVTLLLRPDDLFADVGANAGTYSILASKVAGARTVAFEPNDAIRAVLARQLAANGIEDRVTTRSEAVGDHIGAVRFTTALGTMNKVVENFAPGTIEVPMTTLDQVFTDAEPLAIKLDIEGGEDGAIAGADQLLQSPALRVLLIETVAAPTLARLRQVGFEEIFFDPFARALHDRSLDFPQNNRLFVRDRAFVEERLAGAQPLDVMGVVL
jgi:FkbM family methyltransferase